MSLGPSEQYRGGFFTYDFQIIHAVYNNVAPLREGLVAFKVQNRARDTVGCIDFNPAKSPK